ncbi:MAG TPA: hypothetical protein VKB69_12580, partial [Micromonosporaceae bacterium]|nr:hypothetical protein [Micromonosporaceae bacterium]
GAVVMLILLAAFGVFSPPGNDNTSSSVVSPDNSTLYSPPANQQPTNNGQQATSPTPTHAPTSTHAAPTHAPPPPTHTSKPTHPPTSKPKGPLCGAPSNPWGFNFCGRGHAIYSANLPGSVCAYFDCIPNFPNGVGYMIECNDSTYSMSGGRSGACSHHKGEWREVYSGP